MSASAIQTAAMAVESAETHDLATIESVREAFAVFERQSHQLEVAYRSLEQDLAVANRELQDRNVALTDTVGALQAVSSRLESVIESLTDGLLVVDPDGVVMRCNAVACRILERERDAVEGMPIFGLVTDAEAPEALRRVLAGGDALVDQSWCIDDDADSRYLRYSLAPVSGPGGDVLGAVCNVRDVTDLRRLEKRVESNKRLAALGEMAASVAHEIRNPLGTIEGFARLLRRDLADMPDHLRLAERIVAGAQNLNYVISNLLTYVRPMHLQETDVAVSRLLQACRETLEDRAGQVSVALALPGVAALAGVMVRGDERQLAQALLNIGINAIEACEPDGAVAITVERRRAAVVIRIQDTGCGMTPDAIGRVFDPFFTAKEGGTGLGLSLTRKIIDAHGGEIEIESAPGRGSTFSVILPGCKKAGVAA